jgi:hypothetical protein
MDGALLMLEDEDEPKSIDFSRVKTKLLEDLFKKIQNLPIYVFYKYLWEKKKPHLFLNLFVNYIFPIILESLPW